MIEQRLRVFLLGVAVLIAVGTPLELLLSEHWGSLPQWIPFILSAASLMAMSAVWWRPGRMSLRVAWWVSLSCVLGGCFGVWEHLEHNVEFAAEIQPNAAWDVLFLEGITGANPLLAPGIFVVVGLLGWAGIWRHPAVA